MNENLYIAHKKLPHKTLHVHSARGGACNTGRLFETPSSSLGTASPAIHHSGKSDLKNGYYIKWSISKQNP